MVRSPYYQEQLTEGLLYQRYHPDIHSLTCSDMTNETVDAGFALITKLNTEYAEKKQHLQMLYIVDDAYSTPYLLKRIPEALKTLQPQQTHSSAVVADSFLNKVLETLIAPIVNKFAGEVIMFFATETEAFEWLDKRRSELDEEISQQS